MLVVTKLKTMKFNSGGLTRLVTNIELSKILQGEEKNFNASEGWKWAFCKRHGIRKPSFQGEKLSVDKEAADQFVPRFRRPVDIVS